MATRARRVRIQTADGETKVESVVDTFPIMDVRAGLTIGASKGASDSAPGLTWEGNAVKNMAWHSMAQSRYTGIDQKVFHACCNGGGLHWGTRASGGDWSSNQCGFVYGRSQEEMELDR